MAFACSDPTQLDPVNLESYPMAAVLLQLFPDFDRIGKQWNIFGTDLFVYVLFSDVSVMNALHGATTTKQPMFSMGSCKQNIRERESMLLSLARLCLVSR